MFDCNWFIAKSYSNLTEIFVLGLLRIVANQTECSRLEQRSVIKFLLAEKCKPCEIYTRMCIVYREAWLSQRLLTNGLNIGLPLRVRVKKTVNGAETHWFSGKKKFQAQQSVKKEHERDQWQLISLKKVQL